MAGNVVYVTLTLVVAGVSASRPEAVAVWISALVVIAAVADDRRHRCLAVQSAVDELLGLLARVIEHRDDDTGTHMARISEYSRIIALRLGWTAAAADELKAASAMHDVGKVAIPDTILLKPGPLTPAEREVMQTHALIGHEMLAGSSNPVVRLAADIALTHHEHWDGSGYPHGTAGDEISPAGRIVAVADVFDALTSDRVYRRAMPVERAVEFLRSSRGRQFDPRVLDAFLESLDEIIAVGRLAEVEAIEYADRRAIAA